MVATYLTDTLISGAFYGHPSLPFVYINNPKSACSTIKASLWRYTDQREGKKTLVFDQSLHVRTGRPFVTDILTESEETKSHILNKPFMSVVRNPYTRIASSYLHKLMGADPHLLEVFCDRYYLRAAAVNSETLPLQDFLEIIAFDDPLLLNPHFRCQSINIMAPLIDYDFIGHLEDMTAVGDYLTQHNVSLVSANVVGTTASMYQEKLLGYLTPESMELIRAIFQRDFEAFGYATGGGPTDRPATSKTNCSDSLSDVIKGTARYSSLPLAPELMSYYQFLEAPDDDVRLAIAESMSFSHRNRGILRQVGAFLASRDRHTYVSDIREQLHHCHFGHLNHISNKSIIDTDRVQRKPPRQQNL